MHKISKFCTSETCKHRIGKEKNSKLCTTENASKLSTGECIKLANQNGSSVSRLSLALWGIKGQVDVTAGEW